MNAHEIQRSLRDIGWPIAVDGNIGPQTRQAVWDFQLGFTPRNLAVDGIAGPDTQDALKGSLVFGGACGENFFYREWRSKGNGWLKVHRELVRGLVAYRRLLGGAVGIVSGYRDPAHNTRVGGASNSQHLYGTAADIAPLLQLSTVRALGVFSGIGYQGDGRVRHVDVRHAGPVNPTGGRPNSPTVWRY